MKCQEALHRQGRAAHSEEAAQACWAEREAAAKDVAAQEGATRTL